MGVGFKPDTLSNIEEELYYLEEKNENQYSSLLGYEKLRLNHYKRLIIIPTLAIYPTRR
jgi:hypothetical protein